MAAFFGKFGDFPVEDGVQGLSGVLGSDVLLCFPLADDLYLRGLFAAERHFISEYFVFNRIFERGVENHPDGLATDEPHFYQALTKTSVPCHLCDNGFFAGFKF